MAGFKSFVIFAEMRTGSNLLEDLLSCYPGVRMFGEAFNPAFLCYPADQDVLGINRETRDADPRAFLSLIKDSTSGLPGFRYFHDHDPRVLTPILDDVDCAKIILTRNPVDSYVSLKIARETGQWRLTDERRRREASVTFDPSEFREFVDTRQRFRKQVERGLQTRGQTAFHLHYEDLSDSSVVDGLATFLGLPAPNQVATSRLRRQNPSALREKVSNFKEMERALAAFDPFDLSRTPDFEPIRGPAVTKWVTCRSLPLQYLPNRSSIDTTIESWMALLEGSDPSDLVRGRGQKDLRRWMRDKPGHRSFMVLTHPLERAHDAFCHRILNTGTGGFPAIRRMLMRRYKLGLPERSNDPGYGLSEHKAAFLGFLRFLRANLTEQTPVRIDPSWASQANLLQGYARFTSPDYVLREHKLNAGLTELAKDMGKDPVAIPRHHRAVPFDLARIYDSEIERAARAAYVRDYIHFGFADWRGAD